MDIGRWIKAQWDRVAAVVAVILGLVALLLGWLGVSDSGLPAEQIPYLASGAVFGLFALGVGATLWLSADLRDEWRKLDDIYKRMEQLPSSSLVTNSVSERYGFSETDDQREKANG
jgi:hypothetical protein